MSRSYPEARTAQRPVAQHPLAPAGFVLLVLGAALAVWVALIVGLLGLFGLVSDRTGTTVLQLLLVAGLALLVRGCIRHEKSRR